jgi:L-alanine-DL-glutamate epimerase-like enolase superfamily enzyme
MKITEIRTRVVQWEGKTAPLPPHFCTNPMDLISPRLSPETMGTFTFHGWLIVEIFTDQGLVGIGNAALSPLLTKQLIDQHLAPLLIGESPWDTEFLWQHMYRKTMAFGRKGVAMIAISAVDIALWDLMGKAMQRPVHQLLGGALRSRVPAYVTGFYYRDGERPDDLRREAAMYLEHGYRTVKVKVAGLPPEADAERVGVIRKAVGDDVAIMLDANQGWNLPSAVRTAKLCEPYNIFWLEDPMPWYDERHSLRRLKAEVNIPISAGETEFTPFGLRTMVAEGLVDYLIIDSTWAGGLTVWRKAAVMAELYQIPMAAHHDPQIHVHAVAASPTGFILESFADHTRDPLWFELFRERPKIVDGYMAVPDTPGLGLELRPETLEKYGVKLG